MFTNLPLNTHTFLLLLLSKVWADEQILEQFSLELVRPLLAGSCNDLSGF